MQGNLGRRGPNLLQDPLGHVVGGPNPQVLLELLRGLPTPSGNAQERQRHVEPDLGEARRQAKGLLVVAYRVRGAAHRIQDQSQVAVHLGIAGRELERDFILGNGLVKAVGGVRQGIGEVGVRRRRAGGQLERLLELHNGVIQALRLSKERSAQVGVGGREFRLEPERLLELSDRVVEAVGQLGQRASQVVVGLGEVGLQEEGLLEFRNRLAQVALVLVPDPEVAVGLRIVLPDPERGLVVAQCLPGIPVGLVPEAEAVLGHPALGIILEGGGPERLRVREVLALGVARKDKDREDGGDCRHAKAPDGLRRAGQKRGGPRRHQDDDPDRRRVLEMIRHVGEEEGIDVKEAERRE